jgi:hypothetical protein
MRVNPASVCGANRCFPPFHSFILKHGDLGRERNYSFPHEASLKILTASQLMQNTYLLYLFSAE